MPVVPAQPTKGDRLWLDEYAKRGFARNSYGAASMAFTWTLIAKVTQMLLDKSCGKVLTYHPTRTPALMAGLSIIGLVLSYVLYDQETGLEKLNAQRLAKRIGLDKSSAEGDEKKYVHLPDKVSWRHVLTPGGRSIANKMRNLSPEEKRFEREWQRKYMLRAMKWDLIGGIQYGALYSIFPFVLGELMAKGNADKVNYRHPQTSLAVAAIITTGVISQYQAARYATEKKLLLDNYQAREIARKKGTLHDGTSDISALFTGEKQKGNNPFLEYDRKWLKENGRTRARWFILSTLTNTVFYGAISIVANMVLKKGAGEEVKFRPLQSSATISAAAAFGAACSYMGSRAEAQVYKQEDDRLAMRITGQMPDSEGNLEEPTGEKSAVEKKNQQSGYWQKKLAASRSLAGCRMAHAL